jgi:hypothetical protein
MIASIANHTIFGCGSVNQRVTSLLAAFPFPVYRKREIAID